MPYLSLQLLGSFQAALDEQPLTGFESNKGRALLAYPAMSPGRAFSRDFLSGLVVDSLPFEEWAVIQRERLHRLALDTFDHLARHYRCRRDYPRPRRYARR